jgi:hypothetical protein
MSTCAWSTAKREGCSQQSGPLNSSWFGDYSSYFYHSKKDICDIKVCGDLAKLGIIFFTFTHPPPPILVSPFSFQINIRWNGSKCHLQYLDVFL